MLVLLMCDIDEYVGSGVMTFHEDWGIHIQTHRQQDDFSSLLLFLQKKERKVKNESIN
jgi:hypothetical protein